MLNGLVAALLAMQVANADVTGTVRDRITEEVLPGAVITLEDGARSSLTGDDGRGCARQPDPDEELLGLRSHP